MSSLFDKHFQFLISIVEIQQHFQLHLIQYADDSTLHSSNVLPKTPSINTSLSSKVYTISSSNDDLEGIASWGTHNLVNLNDQKSQFQLMTPSNFEVNSQIQNTIIRPTKTFKILGFTVSSNLSWKPYIQQIDKSASSNLGFLSGVVPFSHVSSCSGYIKTW